MPLKPLSEKFLITDGLYLSIFYTLSVFFFFKQTVKQKNTIAHQYICTIELIPLERDCFACLDYYLEVF